MTAKTIIILGLVSIFIIGLIALFIRLFRVAKKIEFAGEYRNKFIEFANKFVKTYDRFGSSGDFDGEMYVWLTMNVTKIQDMLGSFGIMTFKPAFANYMVNEYQIIANALPKFREGKIDNFDVNSVDDCLLRFLGNLEDYKVDIIKKMKNPFVWFREGFNEIFRLPILLFYWFGIFGQRTMNTIISSLLFKLISGLFALTAFISSVVTIIIGYDKTLEIIQKFMESK